MNFRERYDGWFLDNGVPLIIFGIALNLDLDPGFEKNWTSGAKNVTVYLMSYERQC